MAHFSVEELQKIAVEVTSDFYNHGVPLSEGLAKQASARDLNSDQLKRAVEATNTLAYLKSVESANDRTGEFPLANYDEILKCASIPDSLETSGMMMNGVVPSIGQDKGDGLVPPTSAEDTVKEASYHDPLAFEMPQLTKQAALKFLIKEACANKQALELAESRALNLYMDLTKQASVLKKDPNAIYGVSIAAKDEQFTKLAKLVFGDQAPSRIDYVDVVPAHRDWKASMQKAAALSTMLTDAADTLVEIEQRRELDKQASLIMDAGKLVGSAAKKVVTAPLKWGAAKIGAGVASLTDQAATKIQTGFAGTGLGKKMGVQPGTLKPSTVQTMAKAKTVRNVAMIGGGAALDAASFRPKNNPSSNQNGDVWDALN